MGREILKYQPPIDVRGDEFNLPPLGWALHGSVHGWNCGKSDYAGAVDALLDAGATPQPLTGR